MSWFPFFVFQLKISKKKFLFKTEIRHKYNKNLIFR